MFVSVIAPHVTPVMVPHIAPVEVVPHVAPVVTPVHPVVIPAPIVGHTATTSADPMAHQITGQEATLAVGCFSGMLLCILLFLWFVGRER